MLVENRDKYPDVYCVTFRQLIEYVHSDGDLKQTLAIGPESVNPIIPDPSEPPPEPAKPDDPADPGKTVTGLVRYVDPSGKNDVIQEMIATGTAGERTIIRKSERDRWEC